MHKIIALPTFRKHICIGGDTRKLLNLGTGYTGVTVSDVTGRSYRGYNRVCKIPLSTAKAVELATSLSMIDKSKSFDGAVFLPRNEFSHLGIKAGDQVLVGLNIEQIRSSIKAATPVVVADSGVSKPRACATTERPKSVAAAVEQIARSLAKGAQFDVDAVVTQLVAAGYAFRGRPAVLESIRTRNLTDGVLRKDGNGFWRV